MHKQYTYEAVVGLELLILRPTCGQPRYTNEAAKTARDCRSKTTRNATSSTTPITSRVTVATTSAAPVGGLRDRPRLLRRSQFSEMRVRLDAEGRNTAATVMLGRNDGRRSRRAGEARASVAREDTARARAAWLREYVQTHQPDYSISLTSSTNLRTWTHPQGATRVPAEP